MQPAIETEAVYFLPDLLRKLGVSAPTFRKMREQRRFTPKPLSNGNRLAWRQRDVDLFLSRLPRELIRDPRGRKSKLAA